MILTTVFYTGKIICQPFEQRREQMENRNQVQCTAFAGFRRIASGELAQVAVKTKQAMDEGEESLIRIFDDVTGERIELDFRGTAEDVLNRLAESSAPCISTEAESDAPRGP